MESPSAEIICTGENMGKMRKTAEGVCEDTTQFPTEKKKSLIKDQKKKDLGNFFRSSFWLAGGAGKPEMSESKRDPKKDFKWR